MTSTLFIVQIVLAILITILVLLQKSSSIGLGAYSGSNESVFGAKGPAGFLTKATFTLGLLFVVNTLALGYFYSQENKKSAVDTIKSEIPAPTAKPLVAPKAKDEQKSVVPSAPATPSSDSNKSEAPAPKADAKSNTEAPKATEANKTENTVATKAEANKTTTTSKTNSSNAKESNTTK